MAKEAEGETENTGGDEEENTVTDADEEEENETGGSFNAIGHIDQLVAERGGGEKAAKALARKFFWENKKLRSKLRSARKRAVDDKDFVLKGDEATAVKKLLTLGKPDDIEKRLASAGDLEKKVKENERDSFFADVADRLGFSSRKGKKAFIRVAKREGLDIQDRESSEEDPETGKKVKVLRPMAKLLTEGDDKFRALEDFLEDDLGEFLPAFQAEDDDESDSESRESVTRDTPTKDRKLTPMVSQSRTTGKRVGQPQRAAVSGALANRYKPKEK